MTDRDWFFGGERTGCTCPRAFASGPASPWFHMKAGGAALNPRLVYLCQIAKWMTLVILAGPLVAISVLLTKDLFAVFRGGSLNISEQLLYIARGGAWWSSIMIACVLPIIIFQDFLGASKRRIDWNLLSAETQQLTWQDCLRRGIFRSALDRARRGDGR
jgi:hypothetical protein